MKINRSIKKQTIKKMDEMINDMTVELYTTSDEKVRRETEGKLERLIEFRSKMSDNKPGTIAPLVIGGVFNLAGILLILNYEKLDILTSKAISMVKK